MLVACLVLLCLVGLLASWVILHLPDYSRPTSIPPRAPDVLLTTADPGYNDVKGLT